MKWAVFGDRLLVTDNDRDRYMMVGNDDDDDDDLSMVDD